MRYKRKIIIDRWEYVKIKQVQKDEPKNMKNNHIDNMVGEYAISDEGKTLVSDKKCKKDGELH